MVNICGLFKQTGGGSWPFYYKFNCLAIPIQMLSHRITLVQDAFAYDTMHISGNIANYKLLDSLAMDYRFMKVAGADSHS